MIRMQGLHKTVWVFHDSRWQFIFSDFQFFCCELTLLIEKIHVLNMKHLKDFIEFLVLKYNFKLEPFGLLCKFTTHFVILDQDKKFVLKTFDVKTVYWGKLPFRKTL